MEKLSLYNWLNNLLDVPYKGDDVNERGELIMDRTVCSKCKWKNLPEDDELCVDCCKAFNLGNWEFEES